MINYKPIKPINFNEKALVAVLTTAMQGVGQDQKEDYHAIVKHFSAKNDTKHRHRTDVKTDKIIVTVFPTGSADAIQNFIRLDEGTKPHIIRPRRGKVLVFQANYERKTSYRLIGSRKGGRSGELVFTKQVRHTGTKGIEVQDELVQKWTKEFHTRMIAAFSIGIKATGHAM